MNLKYVLSLATPAMNVTVEKDGLSPCLLVFGISPTLPIASKEFPEQKKGMKALQTARSKMVQVIARLRYGATYLVRQTATFLSALVYYCTRKDPDMSG